MAHRFNADYPTKPVLIWTMFCGIFGLIAGPVDAYFIKDALTSGRIYSFAVIFDSDKMVYRNSSPTEFWTIIGFLAVTGLTLVYYGVSAPISTMVAYKKKLERQEREKNGGV